MKFFTLLLILLLTVSCQHYKYQVATTYSDSAKPVGYFHVHLNDTVTIAYSFWADNGSMSFVLYNKSDKPIYIDWKKSSFIYQGVRQTYWEDKETKVVAGTSTTISKSTDYKNSTFSLFSTNVLGFGAFSAVETTRKEERITFIPPKSQYAKTAYELTSKPFNIKGANVEMVPRNDNPRKTTKVKTKDFKEEDSPLRFRNFITWSTREDFKEERYIDDSFFVNQIVSIDEKHFLGEDKGARHEIEWEYPYARPDKFYIKFVPLNR